MPPSTTNGTLLQSKLNAGFTPSQDPNYNPSLGADTAPKNTSTSDPMNAELQQFQASNAALQAALAPGVAPTLNLNAINAAAQQSAQNNVNPLYTSYLNQYLQQESANQQAAQSQNQLNLQGSQSALGNTLAQNTLAQQAAASSNALTQGNINAQQTNYELDSGNAQNQKLQALQQNVGQGNLGASGLGQQQIYNAENAKNTADAQQRGTFQYQRDTNNLSTQDTFAQLAQSSQYAGTAEGEQESQFNFNLNDYLRQAAFNDAQYKEQLSASQQQAITAQTQQYQAQAVQQALQAATPVGSKNYVAGIQAYGNLLNPSLSLPTAPSQNEFLPSYGASV